MSFSKNHLFKIESTYSLPSAIPASYLQVIQEIVDRLIPDSFLIESVCNPNPRDLSAFFYRFSKSLPIIQYGGVEEFPSKETENLRSKKVRKAALRNGSDLSLPALQKSSYSLPITFLIPAEYTHGAGRYLSDTLSRWLIPGKITNITSYISLNFRFAIYPEMTFFMIQETLFSNDLNDLHHIQTNLPTLIEEIKINIMAVYHARYISSLRSSSPEHKQLIIQENISCILNQSENKDQNLYDQMQVFFAKSTAEEKLDEIKKNISYLLTNRPKIFDRNLFYEIAYYSALFKDSFSSQRHPKHLSRVIAYQYLFKKILSDKIKKNPQNRHLSLKVLRTVLNENEPIVSILFGFNFLKDTERFEAKHLMEAIKALLPDAKCLPDSMIVDRRHDKIRFFYLELAKRSFTPSEIKALKVKLSQEILRQIENVVHPVFMPRNDEELIRNLIVLNKQIKYKRDIPQVSIHYETQSESDLNFTVIFARLLSPSSPPLSKLLQKNISSMKFAIEDVRISGYLKNKYPKESAILKITVDKSPFFRTDYSVDLLRARQKISIELKKLLGEFRDFNGGIILKQEESLTQLRECMGSLTAKKELLLENYFYSLRPAIMQTVYDSTTLKTHFELFLKTKASSLAASTYQIQTSHRGKYLLCCIKGISPSFKEKILEVIAAQRIPSYDFTTSFSHIDQTALLGIILRKDHRHNISLFKEKIEETMSRWSENFACSLYRS